VNTDYIDPLQPTNPIPSDSTYAQIDFDTDIELRWINQPIYLDIQHNIATTIDLNPSQSGLKVLLPDTSFQSVGAQFRLNNITAFDVDIYTSSGQLLLELTPSQPDSPDSVWLQVVKQTSVQINNWRTMVAGSTSNVFDISQIIANGLQIADGQSLTVRQNVGIVQDVLPIDPSQPLNFAINPDSAFSSISYTIMVDETLGRQCNVGLALSSSMAEVYGYFVTFVNASKYPIVLFTTSPGQDTINNIYNQSGVGGEYSSFVIDIGETCSLIATPANGWRASITNSIYKQAMRTTQLDISTAQISRLGNDYYIDFSNAYDVAYTNILVLTGQLDQNLYPITTTNGLYLVMPNNISNIYYIRSLMTGFTDFYIGLGVMIGSTPTLQTTGTRMKANTDSAVDYSYICFVSNNSQTTDIHVVKNALLG
jgi:hypothetical protein